MQWEWIIGGFAVAMLGIVGAVGYVYWHERERSRKLNEAWKREVRREAERQWQEHGGRPRDALSMPRDQRGGDWRYHGNARGHFGKPH